MRRQREHLAHRKTGEAQNCECETADQGESQRAEAVHG
jgi:hypothetical protein